MKLTIDCPECGQTLPAVEAAVGDPYADGNKTVIPVNVRVQAHICGKVQITIVRG